MDQVLRALNKVLANPTKESIFGLFDRDGFIRFNMLYISPIALKFFREKLHEHGLLCWSFTETGLVFRLSTQVVSFRGSLTITRNGARVFSLELDFDPIISTSTGVTFLRDIEAFLKKCDACFFMTYFICIDSEILSNLLSRSAEYLARRNQAPPY